MNKTCELILDSGLYEYLTQWNLVNGVSYAKTPILKCLVWMLIDQGICTILILQKININEVSCSMPKNSSQQHIRVLWKITIYENTTSVGKSCTLNTQTKTYTLYSKSSTFLSHVPSFRCLYIGLRSIPYNTNSTHVGSRKYLSHFSRQNKLSSITKTNTDFRRGFILQCFWMEATVLGPYLTSASSIFSISDLSWIH